MGYFEVGALLLAAPWILQTVAIMLVDARDWLARR